MAQRVMLALVSDQPMPNVMAVLQHEPRPDHIEFIVSADKGDVQQYDRWYDGKYHALCRALRQLGLSCDRMPPAHPYRLQDVKARCLEAVTKHADAESFVFNVTGGTKLMALAAYLVALEVKKPVVYVESRDRRLITISPAASDEKPFDESRFSDISVKLYLEAYGRTITSERDYKSIVPRELEAARWLASQLPGSFQLLNKVIRAVQSSSDHAAPRRLMLEPLTERQQQQRATLELLETQSYLVPASQASEFVISDEADWAFLRGGWLEVYAFDALYRSGHFDDVRANVCLSGSPGELDVVLTRNASMAICDAKFGATMSIVLGRLRALRETLAGVYGRTFYITARQQVTQDMKNLARLYGISEIITGPRLTELAEIVRDRM